MYNDIVGGGRGVRGFSFGDVVGSFPFSILDVYGLYVSMDRTVKK